MLLKPLDFGIAIPALGVVFLSFYFAYAVTDGRSLVNLKAQDSEWVFPLDAVETMSVSGPLGDTLVEIRENSVRITASPCMNQTCVATGAIHSPGQWAACLPNRVMVYITANATGDINENDVDAAAW
jgi:hypothetical protein